MSNVPNKHGMANTSGCRCSNTATRATGRQSPPVQPPELVGVGSARHRAARHVEGEHAAVWLPLGRGGASEAPNALA